MLKADGGAEWELGNNRIVQVSIAAAANVQAAAGNQCCIAGFSLQDDQRQQPTMSASGIADSWLTRSTFPLCHCITLWPLLRCCHATDTCVCHCFSQLFFLLCRSRPAVMP
jgi:hypothetical protein